MDTKQKLARRIDQALGRDRADLVIKNARILNVADGSLEPGDVAICGDTIVGIYDEYSGAREIDGTGQIVAPGFIDTHVHVESTMITPAEFDRCVLPRGTTTAICDPHEISNVLGERGLGYFLDASTTLNMDLRVQLSSCVPSTHLETAGATLTAADLVKHRGHPSVIGLAEFMNFPGIFAKDPEVMDKLAAFDGGHIDGHAPLVSGRELNAYCAVGIHNCHETTGLDEAREKLSKGMQVLMRDGSVTKDVAILTPLLNETTSPFVAFCTDDRNPLDIDEEGHVDHLIRTAIKHGAPPHMAYRSASWSAARGFRLHDRGLVAPGYLADLVLLSDLAQCDVQTVIKSGQLVSELAPSTSNTEIGRHSIQLDPTTTADFATPTSGPSGPVIGIIPDSVVTEHLTLSLPYVGGLRQTDPHQDVAKVCVFARHGVNRNIGRGFVRGFNIQDGALASSVGHDSHNVCVVGANDRDMSIAVNRLIELEGGFVAVRNGNIVAELALPIAGLMSDLPFEAISDQLGGVRRAARDLGCQLSEPFLQLAFLPLPVIPHLKITDHGLVDVDRFQVIAA